MLPQNTLLGKLDIIEIYEYHDKPLLFACRNATYTHYMVVQETVHPDYEAWLYAPISPSRFEQARSGVIDLHDVFKHSEDGFVFWVKIPTESLNPIVVQTLPTDQLTDDQIPDVGEFLDPAHIITA